LSRKDDLSLISAILAGVNYSKQDLAHDSDLNTSTLSSYFSGNKPISDSSFRVIYNAVEAHLRTFDGTESIASGMWGLFNKINVEKILNVKPGNSINTNSENHIELLLDCDSELVTITETELFQRIDADSPFTSIYGPSKSGKSSLADRISNFFINKGSRVMEVNIPDFTKRARKENKVSIFHGIIASLARNFQVDSFDELSSIKNAENHFAHLGIWFKSEFEKIVKEASEGFPLIVIIDNIKAQYFPNGLEGVDNFYHTLKSIRKITYPDKQIFFVLIMEASTIYLTNGSYFPDVFKGYRVLSLSKQNIKTLLQCYGISTDNYTERIFKEFKGHPFLTHFFINYLSETSDISKPTLIWKNFISLVEENKIPEISNYIDEIVAQIELTWKALPSSGNVKNVGEILLVDNVLPSEDLMNLSSSFLTVLIQFGVLDSDYNFDQERILPHKIALKLSKISEV